MCIRDSSTSTVPQISYFMEKHGSYSATTDEDASSGALYLGHGGDFYSEISVPMGTTPSEARWLAWNTMSSEVASQVVWIHGTLPSEAWIFASQVTSPPKGLSGMWIHLSKTQWHLRSTQGWRRVQHQNNGNGVWDYCTILSNTFCTFLAPLQRVCTFNDDVIIFLAGSIGPEFSKNPLSPPAHGRWRRWWCFPGSPLFRGSWIGMVFTRWTGRTIHKKKQ